MSNKISSISARNVKNLEQSKTGSVLCYGHFNVIHPGHIRFLQHAKSLGNKLTTAVIGDQSIPEDQRARYFSQDERAEGVASLQFVDNVIILDQISLQSLVSQYLPKILVLGKEFEKKQSPDLKSSIELIESIGGQVIFHAGEIHYASLDLLHGSQPDVETERRNLFLQSCRRQNLDPNVLVNRIKEFSNCRLLVLGDTIVDQYVACDAIGLSAEAPVLVVKELEAREFIGGAAIVAAHVKALGASCTYLSVAGQDENAEIVRKNLQEQGVSVHLLEDESRPTTFKIRYMVENQKLFRVSRLKDHTLSKTNEDRFIERLWELAPHVDGIIVCDFVYGVITLEVVKAVQQIAKEFGVQVFGDLQCSSQVGNVSKFEGFDLICPTEKEARIALSNHQDGVEWVANKLMEQTRSKNLVVKLGAEGFISYHREEPDGFVNREHFPALVSNPVDVAGAGDSLLAALAVSRCSGGSLMEASAIAACMAAIAVQTVGNVPVSRDKLDEFIKNLEST